MEYITTLQAAEKWGISQRRVAILCAQHRINGVKKVGKTWLIPYDSDKPADERFETEVSVASEPSVPYLVKTELMLDAKYVQVARRFYSEKGQSLSEGINDYIKKLASETDKNCMDSYPAGFFRLFGSASKLDFPDSIEDIKPEEITI